MFLFKYKYMAMALLFVFTTLTIAVSAHSCSLKDDEDVLFFNTFGHRNIGEGTLSVNIHGWIFEREDKSLWRRFAKKLFINKADFPRIGPELTQFSERSTYFLADNESDKALTIQIGELEFQLPASQKNGHFETVITLPVSELTPLNSADWVFFRIHEGHKNSTKFSGQCNIINETGISVISDIDDTIKISNILNKRDKLRGAFLYPFAGTEGTAKAYSNWESEGAAFHYVTGSPWQLYPFLKEGAADTGFPQGSFHMVSKDISPEALFKKKGGEVGNFKVDTITEIINAFPGRKYILVGDCGQHDPEVYAEIYQLFPEQILHIFVREIKEGDMSTERFDKTFKDVPKDMWDIFSDETVNLLQDYSIVR